MKNDDKSEYKNNKKSKKIQDREFSIPLSHPRYESLKLRELITDGVMDGITAPEGLIAHGRGEAFDYIIGETTIAPADDSIRASAAHLLLAKNPIISVNGNVAALAPLEIVNLGKIIPAKIEVNIFHFSRERFSAIIKRMKKYGAVDVLGEHRDKLIPGLDSARAKCTKDGIYTSDVVLVPLEDGDRAYALRKMGKLVITIDLNPFSRTAQVSNITIVDNLVRSIPLLHKYIEELRDLSEKDLVNSTKSFDNVKNLKKVLNFIKKRLTNFQPQSGI